MQMCGGVSCGEKDVLDADCCLDLGCTLLFHSSKSFFAVSHSGCRLLHDTGHCKIKSLFLEVNPLSKQWSGIGNSTHSIKTKITSTVNVIQL